MVMKFADWLKRSLCDFVENKTGTDRLLTAKNRKSIIENFRPRKAIVCSQKRGRKRDFRIYTYNRKNNITQFSNASNGPFNVIADSL